MNEIRIINELKKKLEALLPMEGGRSQMLEKKFRLEFNYNTNHIEGNTITYSETELLLIFDNVKGDHTLRELEEMKGSDVAYQYMKELAIEKERPLTEQHIKSLNELLLVRPFWKEAITPDGQPTRRLIKVGEYKQFPNSVRLANGEIFHYTSPTDTPIQMAELVSWYKEETEKQELHPVVLAALLHYKFVRIHPFGDGNGRVSRLLMNFVLFRNDFPPVIIKSDDKREYLSALNRADTGDLNAFVAYICRQMIWSLEISIKAAKGESIDEPGDLDKKLKLLKQQLNVGESRVKILRSYEAITSVFENSIKLLINIVSKQLSDFRILFNDGQENLYLGNSPWASTLNEAMENVVESAWLDIQKRPVFYRQIFKDFRKFRMHDAISCGLEISLFNNVFCIRDLNSDFELTKRYDETISEEEMKYIAELLGTHVFNAIEKAMDAHNSNLPEA
ncbi:MAG: Fic family protein [Chitinophagales bacterium]